MKALESASTFWTAAAERRERMSQPITALLFRNEAYRAGSQAEQNLPCIGCGHTKYFHIPSGCFADHETGLRCMCPRFDDGRAKQLEFQE